MAFKLKKHRLPDEVDAFPMTHELLDALNHAKATDVLIIPKDGSKSFIMHANDFEEAYGDPNLSLHARALSAALASGLKLPAASEQPKPTIKSKLPMALDMLYLAEVVIHPSKSAAEILRAVEPAFPPKSSHAHHQLGRLLVRGWVERIMSGEGYVWNPTDIGRRVLQSYKAGEMTIKPPQPST